MKSGYVIQRKDGKYLQRDASGQGVEFYARRLQSAVIFDNANMCNKGERAVAVEMVVRRKKKWRGNV